jgi:hypothetical protein
LTCVAGLAVLAMAPRPAHAGATDFGWLYGTEVMPERGIELQTWLAEENRLDDAGRETQWWLGPSIGLTDRLELVLPVQINHDFGGGFTYNGLWSYGAELRYRFVTPDPVDRPAFAPLVRVAVNRMVYTPGAVDVQADLVGSYEAGRVLALVDLGGDAEVSSSGHQLTLMPGAGVSVRIRPALRVGIESHAELPDGGTSWLIIGPDLAWTFGRLWLSAAYGFGVLHGGNAPKVQWGIAF